MRILLFVKRVFLSLFVLVLTIPLVGAYLVLDQDYFYIQYNFDGIERSIVVSDKSISPKWFFAESQNKFTKGMDLFQRASVICQKQLSNPQKVIRDFFPELHRIIQRIESEVYRPKIEPTVNFDPGREGKFWITGGEDGRELNTKQLCADILELLREPTNDKPIFAQINALSIKTEREILSQIVERGRYFTNFEDNTARESNIALALEDFNGLVIQPNQTVSFNDIVGRRTAERGFQMAKIIIDGEFVPGIGGGVCQASTTIFNAALLAGMKIVESHNHSLPISYVPLGRDAMVSSVADLRLKNTTDAPLYIEAMVQDNGRTNTALVKIYGLPSKLKYKPRVEVIAHEQEEQVRGGTPEQLFGFDFETGQFWQYQKKVIQKGYPPRVSKTYLDTLDGGEVVDSKLIRKSWYKGKERVVEYERVQKTVDKAFPLAI